MNVTATIRNQSRLLSTIAAADGGHRVEVGVDFHDSQATPVRISCRVRQPRFHWYKILRANMCELRTALKYPSISLRLIHDRILGWSNVGSNSCSLFIWVKFFIATLEPGQLPCQILCLADSSTFLRLHLFTSLKKIR